MLDWIGSVCAGLAAALATLAVVFAGVRRVRFAVLPGVLALGFGLRAVAEARSDPQFGRHSLYASLLNLGIAMSIVVVGFARGRLR